jgi:tetratricopeptide (TPR) repeat protein
MNASRPLLLFLAIFCVNLKSFSQKIPLIKSGETIEHGKQLYDSGKYEAAISEFLKIAKQDTNYVYGLTELALAYIEAAKYDKAIEVCNEGLAQPSEYGSHLWRSKAIAADRKGDFDLSVRFFDEALSKYPFDHSLIYNLGITYYNHKDYDKAQDCFFKALAINPFHPGSHLNLGRLAMVKGRKTHAAFAMGIYLSISNSDNERLVLLNNFFGNEVTDEGTVTATAADVNACERLDQIIRAGIAMDKKFDSKIPIDAAVVKQFELIFNQLQLIPDSKEDRYINFYLSIYKAIKAKELAESFIYYLLSSSTNEVAKKWLKKNEKSLNAFFGAANIELKEKRKTINAPARFNYTEPIQAWHDAESNKLDALGKMSATEKRQGQWYFFHPDYEKSAEGVYDNEGNKIGIWKFYYRDGRLRSIENYDTGEITIFHPEGEKKEHFYLRNNEIDGLAETFYT